MLTWLITIAVVLATLWWWEEEAKERGFSSHVPDDDDTWALERARLTSHGVALIGTSRILAGVVPERVEQRLDRGTVQLGINSSSSIPLLEDLDASGFAGIAIVDFVSRNHFFDQSSYESKVVAALDRYKRLKASPSRRLEAHLRRALEGRLVFRNPALAPSRVSPFWGSFPKPQRAPMTHRRRRVYDADRVDGRRVDKRKAADVLRSPKPARDDVIEKRIERLERAIRGIEGRGGSVYLVHFPVTGRLAAAEEKMFPRARFWDRVAASTSATTLHFAEIPAMAGLRCFDGSHLAAEDAERFTEALLDVIEQHEARKSSPGA